MRRERNDEEVGIRSPPPHTSSAELNIFTPLFPPRTHDFCCIVLGEKNSILILLSLLYIHTHSCASFSRVLIPALRKPDLELKSRPPPPLVHWHPRHQFYRSIRPNQYFLLLLRRAVVVLFLPLDAPSHQPVFIDQSVVMCDFMRVNYTCGRSRPEKTCIFGMSQNPSSYISLCEIAICLASIHRIHSHTLSHTHAPTLPHAIFRFLFPFFICSNIPSPWTKS